MSETFQLYSETAETLNETYIQFQQLEPSLPDYYLLKSQVQQMQLKLAVNMSAQNAHKLSLQGLFEKTMLNIFSKVRDSSGTSVQVAIPKSIHDELEKKFVDMGYFVLKTSKSGITGGESYSNHEDSCYLSRLLLHYTSLKLWIYF